MKYLTLIITSLPNEKILSNWSNCAAFIYDTVSIDELRSLLRYEVLNKNREMIVQRLKIRLLSVMKKAAEQELNKDIQAIEKRVREKHGDLPKGSD